MTTLTGTKEKGKVQKVYKVVRVLEDGTLTSAWVDPSSTFCTIYNLGKSTRPCVRNTCLMAFSSLDHAEKWTVGVALGPYKYRIYEAIGYNTKKSSDYLPVINSEYIHDADIITFWRTLIPTSSYFKQDTPEGSVFCTSIRLLEVV